MHPFCFYIACYFHQYKIFLFSQLKLFHLEIYACEINITILASFLLAYLGYIFFFKTLFQLFGIILFQLCLLWKAYDWISFLKCSFFPVYWPRNLIHSYYWILSLIFMLPNTLFFLVDFSFPYEAQEKIQDVPREKRDVIDKKKKKNEAEYQRKKFPASI